MSKRPDSKGGSKNKAGSRPGTKGKDGGKDVAPSVDALFTAELEKLSGQQDNITRANTDYSEEHPEINEYIDDFIAQIFYNKPTDIRRFGSLFFNNLLNNGVLGVSPLVISGCSGSGKTLITKTLLQRYPDVFVTAAMHTTRAARPGELNGDKNYFTTKQEYENDLKNKQFLNSTILHTYYYGTSIMAVNKARNSNKICLLNFDVKGLKAIQKSTLDYKSIFLLTQTDEILKARIATKGSPTEDQIEDKMMEAQVDNEYGQKDGCVDQIIFNTTIDECIDKIIDYINEKYMDIQFGKPILPP